MHADGRVSGRFVVVCMSMAALVAMPSAFAQKCSDRNPQVAVDVLQEVLRSC